MSASTSYRLRRSFPVRMVGWFSRLVLFLVVSVVAGVLVAGLVLPAVGAAGLVTRNSADSFESLPEPLTIAPLSQRSRILDSTGKTIATFYDENRILVPITAIAPAMQHAIVAIEDARFYEHGGIDVRGTTRAFVNNQTGDTVQGGSTLTQQYVKLVLLEQARAAGDEKAEAAAVNRTGKAGLIRKAREARYAIGLEKQLSKDEILDRYLNIAYFGSGSYGVEAAARHYFNSTAAKLTVQQSATLAGLLQAPTKYDPSRNPKTSQARRDTVLTKMAEQSYISAAELAEARATATKLEIAPLPNGCSTSKAPYYCEYVKQEILHDPAFGQTVAARKALLDRGGLVIKTTIDPTLQKAAQKAVDTNVPRKDKSGVAAAISMVVPGTGAIAAMAQDRTWGTVKKRGITTINYNVDRAYGGSNYGWQTGSTFKPITAAAAMKEGISLSTTIPTPYELTSEQMQDCHGDPTPPYKLHNDSHSQPGVANFATGLALSMNTWAVGIEQRTGLCNVANMARAVGLHQGSGKAINEFASLTLGTNDIAPLTMAGAYATFAARGKFCQPHAIVEVRDRNNKVLPHTVAACHQVMDKAIADAVNELLVGVIDGPLHGRTGSAQSIGRPAAGKTGTTENNQDVWFDGYTPQMAAVVWVGSPDTKKVDGQYVRPALRNIRINGQYVNRGFGGTLAGPIWKSAMLAAVDGLPEAQFQEPDPDVVRGIEVRVPYVNGYSRDRATSALEREGFSWQIARKRIDGDLPEGRVAYSSPGSGSKVSSGTTITLYLSSGHAPAPSPSPTPAPTFGTIPGLPVPGGTAVPIPPPAAGSPALQQPVQPGG